MDFEVKDNVIVLVGKWKEHTGKVSVLAEDAERSIGVRVDERKDQDGITSAGAPLVWFKPDEIKKAV